MWLSGILFRCRRSPNVMFFTGVLIGMLAFWILDARRASEYLLVRNMDVYKDIIEPQNFHNNRNSSHHAVDYAVAERLREKVRVFAAILTTSRTKLSKAVHAKATWARRFNGYTFFSSEEDKELPSIRVAEMESRDLLWEKVRRALIYIYKNVLNDYDFFMKADDDTYVIVENLRLLLSKYNPNEPILMGRRFNASSPAFFCYCWRLIALYEHFLAGNLSKPSNVGGNAISSYHLPCCAMY